MGKGGTKFSGDAVGVRMKAKGYTLKDAKKVLVPRRRGWEPAVGKRLDPSLACSWRTLPACSARQDMEMYLQTGHHPGMEAQRAKQAEDAVLLPDPSTARPHVFMDLTIGGKPAGTSGWVPEV
jgi:hypothetical protein